MVTVGSGRLIITNGTHTLKISCKNIKVDIKNKPTIKHYAGKTHMGYTMQKRWCTFKGFEAFFKGHTEFSDTMDYLWSFQNDKAFDLEVLRDATNKIEWDGENVTYKVMIAVDGIRGLQKVSPGDQQVYKADLMIFEEAG